MTDTTDIAHAPEQGRAIAPARDSNSMLAMIANAASDPTVDAGKMVTMANLAMQLQDRERQAQFSAAKVAAISEMPRVFKAGKSDKHKYAKFEDMHARVMPILARHELTLNFTIGQQGNLITVEAVLEHTNGVQLRGGPMSMPSDTGPGRNPVQAVASTISYGKRATMKAILNIIETDRPDDDDGNAGGGTGAAPMEPYKRELIQAGERAAKEGPTFYLDWFKGLDTAQKGWLVFEGHHDRLKGSAGKATGASE